MYQEMNSQQPPRDMRLMAFLLCVYLAAPLYPIPLLGVSFSLPLIFLLAFRSRGRWGGVFLEKRGALSLVLYWLWGALLLSMVANSILTDQPANVSESVKYLVQFGVLLLALSLGVRLYGAFDLHASAAKAFAGGVAVMTIFVLLEYVVFGGLAGNGWSHLTRMSQNSYAIQYSAFLPFAYAALVRSRGWAKIVFGGVLVLSLGAVFINGSRTGWATTLLTLSVFVLIYVRSTRKLYLPILLACLVPAFVAVAWIVIPAANKESIAKDFGTLEQLEKDKSWMIRRLQVQKSLRLFEENPILGVGPGQFRYQNIDLDLPDVLAGRRANQFSDVSAHNSYMQFLAEAGLLFMIPFLGFLAWLLARGWVAANQLAGMGEFWAPALFAGFCGLSVHLWTLSGLTTSAPWFYYGLMVAMIDRARVKRGGV